MLLEGLFLPLTTPFTPNGRLHPDKLRDNVARYSKTPASGLVVLGRTGQPSLLSDAETKEALRIAAESAIAEKVLIAGAARDSVDGALDLAAYADEVGYDALLVPLPSLLQPASHTREALTFYRALADSTRLPIVLDTVEDQLPPGFVAELAEHPRIIGILDTTACVARTSELVRLTAGVRRDVTVTTVFAAVTGRMARTARAASTLVLPVDALSHTGSAISVAAAPAATRLKTRTKQIGFQVLCGRTASVLDALQAGAAGAVLPLAASAPQACYEVLAAWKDGDPALALEKQHRLSAAARLVEEQLGVSGIKYACDWNGYFGGRPRLPILPLTAAQREQVETAMQEIRN